MKDNKTMRIVIFIVVMLIPIIYSFFYLKSYWDPYGNLRDMKVAIVNLDEGENGENQGQKIVNKLKDKNVVNICDVSKSEATSGLENEDYYAVITIPENFNKDLSNWDVSNVTDMLEKLIKKLFKLHILQIKK